MALDTLALQCITEELKNAIIGGRIEKVYQPERDEITLNIKSFFDGKIRNRVDI